MNTILIVDDDAQLRRSFSKLLTERGYEVETAASGEQCLERARKGGIDLVIQDIRLPGMDGLETFRHLRDIEPTPQVIVMTAYGTMETAVEATKLGAYDYVLKPFDIPAMLELIEKALETAKRKKELSGGQLDEARSSMDAVLGRSPAMQEVYKAIGRAAPTDATVLICGESGTGKELVARAIYKYSSRANKPFSIINCVAIPETLLESELFGYEKGAFTGAGSRRIGKIELAQQGTVFLDEIGDMPLSIQAKILRLIQERTIERLGGNQAIPVDVRIIAATNRELEKSVQDGVFREDLYFRLKVVTLTLPPLRERIDDIPLLARHFLSLHAHEMELPNPGLSPEGEAALLRYQWPGNVRELSNCLQKAIIFSKGAPLSEKDIESSLRQPVPHGKTPPIDTEDALFQWAGDTLLSSRSEKPYEEAMDVISALLIKSALEMTEGNKTRAAKLLGLTRPTLLAKIDKHRLAMSTKVTGPKSDS
ncbi:sigma-54-dependent Fis family transcriptional regulator [Oceanidesulfovibrio indonesiensis]|uniref:DNA-binding transcriptional regulator NtrC n=1 Tax=Oceanidesulfovibrio indonesiensis TaxID=54767 RepID=A0A7M3MG81_9BACT|nr:sigma-54 dependent transcriptional regulator [Oceanidesulfovibrio indonesiensis]TVM17899.1 sigma-54-dependent Fis family transcriptional regulator [Oceanidesulfovibrio indonesiensis]